MIAMNSDVSPLRTAEPARPMRILLFSSLYPNALQPRHGIFVEQRLRQLLRGGELTAQVMAPVPWFPWPHERFGTYGTYARVAHDETRHGIAVSHPRYPAIPKLGMALAPYLMAKALMGRLRAMQQSNNSFDLIDAHYLYPDGVAAVILARQLNVPVVVTARGTDVNVFPEYRAARRWIQWAAREADGLITVCAALKQRLVDLGISPDKITVLRNGVDRELFQPRDRTVQRQRLGFAGLSLLSVGNLVGLKGHDLVVRALTELPQAQLTIVGDGEERESLKALVQSLGLGKRVRLVGSVPQAELPDYYSAADILVLASSREGLANVLLESMACGTPVAATAVGGTPEVVNVPVAGRLIEERTPQGVARAVRQLQAAYPDREAVRRHSASFGWEATSRGQLDVFRRACAQRRRV